MKYIDAEKLKELLGAKYKEFREKGYREDATYYYFADGLDVAKQLVESLQQEQPEVDLEEEINRFWDSCTKHKDERGGNVIWSNKLEVEVLARHFYEFGLKARNEKN